MERTKIINFQTLKLEKVQTADRREKIDSLGWSAFYDFVPKAHTKIFRVFWNSLADWHTVKDSLHSNIGYLVKIWALEDSFWPNIWLCTREVKWIKNGQIFQKKIFFSNLHENYIRFAWKWSKRISATYFRLIFNQKFFFFISISGSLWRGSY